MSKEIVAIFVVSTFSRDCVRFSKALIKINKFVHNLSVVGPRASRRN
jgi:hypothetical protein